MPPATFNRFELNIPGPAIRDIAVSGANDDAVAYWSTRINRPVKITTEILKAELKEYGAWNEQELSNDSDNWRRLLWIGAHDLKEQARK